MKRRIERKIIASLRKSLKTIAELNLDLEHIKDEDINNTVNKMLENNELFINSDLTLDLWRPTGKNKEK